MLIVTGRATLDSIHWLMYIIGPTHSQDFLALRGILSPFCSSLVSCTPACRNRVLIVGVVFSWINSSYESAASKFNGKIASPVGALHLSSEALSSTST